MRAPKKSNCIGGVFETSLKQTGNGNPMDFELPMWCNYNKDKPAPYTFIRRNVYLTKKIKKRLEDDGIFCVCHPSPGSYGVCGKDCHCGVGFCPTSNGIHKKSLWTFGIIRRFDKLSQKHTVMFEDGSIHFLDMSKEDLEFVPGYIFFLAVLVLTEVVFF